MGLGPRQKQVRDYRGQIPSPGRPTVAWREDRVRFWARDRPRDQDRGRVCRGARVRAGRVPVVSPRWRREPSSHSHGVGSVFVFAEREDIAIWHAQKVGAREIARRLGRDPSTISRELRRNASTRTYHLDYKASIAQWHA